MPPPLLSPWLKDLAAREADRVALSLRSRRSGPSELTFAQLDARSDALASALRGLGLEPGDRLALWLPNGPIWMALHFAAAKAGLMTIPLNTWYRRSEVEHFLALSSTKAVVFDSRFHDIPFVEILAGAAQTDQCAHLRWAIDLADMPATVPGLEVIPFESLQSVGGEPPAMPGSNETMIAFSTSGTTSLPKLAVHREQALVSHARAVTRRAGLDRDDVVLGALPPCGAYGYTLLLASLASGARALQLDWFDLDHLIDLIEQEGVTVMALTEPVMRNILAHKRASRSRLKSLRLVFSAGGTLRDVVGRAERDFGFRVTNVYGSSETLALTSFWGPDADIDTRSEAGGLLVSDGMDVAAFDSAGRILPPGQPGEIRFRGPVITTGYLENAEATSRAFTQDGWFCSNDLGFVDDRGIGRFRYMSRMNDALRIKGFLVDPGEIEEKLLAHPNVAAAQVVGIPDGNGEDMAVAFVVAQPQQAVSEKELRQFCRQAMASYKTPAAIRILDRFPTTRSANGDKVIKTRLRQMATELMSNA